MTVEKQPKPETIHENVEDWFRQFLKHFELNLFSLEPRPQFEATVEDYGSAILNATRLTLQDAGLSEEKIQELWASLLSYESSGNRPLILNADMNKRRFNLIDKEIQGSISTYESMELIKLTKLMREHTESQINLPFEGARKLHQKLIELEKNDLEL